MTVERDFRCCLSQFRHPFTRGCNGIVFHDSINLLFYLCSHFLSFPGRFLSSVLCILTGSFFSWSFLFFLLSFVLCFRFNGSMSVFRNIYWSFKIEHKIFVIQLSRDGGGISISERTRVRSFHLEIDVAAAVWCLESLQELLSNGVSKNFCRKYRGSNMVLLLDAFTNKKGIFLKVTKLFNGTLETIILPAGR